ncbi:hypothetical protein [Candidatus Harpocratesius sp.]
MEEIQNEMIQLGVYALVVRGEGQDLLMSKNVHDYIEIPGLETLLRNFIIDLDKFFEYIYKNDISAYLHQIEKKFQLDLSFLASNLVQNINEMKETDSEEIMIYYLVITKTLEHIRQIVFNQYGKEKIKSFYEKEVGKKLSTKRLQKISQLDDEGDADLSILYNLIFIKFLAEIYQKKKIFRNIEEIIEKKLKHFINQNFL